VPRGALAHDADLPGEGVRAPADGAGEAIRLDHVEVAPVGDGVELPGRLDLERGAEVAASAGADDDPLPPVNIANKGGKGYAKFVRLAKSIDPKRVLHLPVVGLKIKAVILPQIQDGLIKTAVRTATRAYTRGKR
jgi:hypothetical protein